MHVLGVPKFKKSDVKITHRYKNSENLMLQTVNSSHP
jgi:hypothetical protein